MKLARMVVLLAAASLTACTYGAPAAPGGGTSGPVGTTIDVSLTRYPQVAIDAGTAGGYAPALATVGVGTTIRFVNSDTFVHTASAIGGTAFPASSPLTAGAQSASGATLSSGWSSGDLPAGAASPPLLADKPGVYLYGCFYHYGAPMRGKIVVR